MKAPKPYRFRGFFLVFSSDLQFSVPLFDDPCLVLADDHDFIRGDRPLHHLVDLLVKILLVALDDVKARLSHRMLGHKDRAAVLIRENGRLKCADLLGDLYDLLLVKTDQRPEYRERAHFVGDAQRRHGLGSYLSDALARDQGKAL